MNTILILSNTMKRKHLFLVVLFASLLLFKYEVSFSQFSNVTISSGTTANGTFVNGVFTPTANNAVLNVSTLQTALISGANDVVINTTCASCNQAGNVTVGAINALRTATLSQLTFTINAGTAGTISTGVINVGGSATGGSPGTGRHGTNVTLNAGSTLTISGAITTSGSRRGSAVGGNAGHVILASGANVIIAGAITASGFAASGGNTDGGDGGNITIEAGTGIRVTQNITANGGVGAGTGIGGDAGNLFILNGSTTVTTGGGINDGQTAGVITLTPAAGGGAVGALTKQDAGTFVLNGANAYTGSTSVNGGILRIDADASLGTAPGSPTAGHITLNGGGLASTATFTLNANRSISIGVSGGTIDVASGTTLTFSGLVDGGNNLSKTSAGTLTFGTGNVTVNDLAISAGVLNASTGTTFITGNFTNTGTFNHNNGTVDFNGSGDQTIAAVTFHNLETSTGGTKTLSGTTTVNSVLIIGAATSVNAGPHTLNLAGSGSPLVITGTFIQGTSTVNYTNAASTNVAAADYNNLNLTGGARVLANSGTTGISGTFTPGAGAITSNGSTVDFNGSGAQSIPTLSSGYNNLIASNGGTKTAGNLIINNQLTVSPGVTLAMGTNTISGGSLTTSGTGLITTQATASAVPSGRSWSMEVAYNATGAQNVIGGTYATLTASGSGLKTATGSITTIHLSVASGVTLAMGTNTIAGPSLTTSGTGSITTQATTSAIPSGRTWSMEVDYNAAGAQNVISGTYAKLTTSTSGTKTATGAITVNSVLNVAPGVTLTMGTNQLSGASLTTAGTGTLITGVTGTNALPNGRTWTMHVEYNSTGNQLVASGTYQGNLTFNGPGISRTMQDDVTVNGVLALNSGTLVVNGPTEFDSNTLNIMGTVTDAGGTIDASSVDAQVNFGNTSPITIGDLFPTPIDILRISGGSTVTMTADEQIGGLLNLSNGKLKIGDNVLSISGTISNFSKANCLIGSKVSNLAISGDVDMGDSLFFSQSGEENYLNNFTITGDVTVHIGDTLKIRGTLTTENSTGEVKTNDYLTIASESTGSGRIYRVNPSFAFTGKVSVERYAKNKVARRYLFITTPVNDISIRDAWQDDIFITGIGTGGVPCGPGTGNGGVTDRYNNNGFDETTLDLVSVYAYSQDSTARWFAPTNTSTLLKAGKGYRVLYRGPRGPGDAYCDTTINRQSVPMPDSTVMNVKGNIITGNWTVALDSKTSTSPTALGYTLVGNPYACEISFSLLKASNSAMAPTYYTYDPNGPTDTTGYLTVNHGVAAGYHSGGITPYPNPDAIASGQAFFVATNRTVDSVITFMESHKTLTSQPGVFRTNNTDQKLIRIHFATTAGKLIDNAVIRFHDDPTITTAENQLWDAVTFNSGNFIAGIKGTRSFAIQTRPLNFTYDTVMVRVVSATTGDFKLNFTDFATFTEAAEIWLLDAFTGAVHNVKVSPVYSFTITSNAASQGGRFKLAFRSLMSVMPVSFLNISAAKKLQGVEVKWTVAQERNILTYEVERSRNGQDFTSIAYVPSKGNSNIAVDYDFMDTNPLNGNAYYRIKSVEKASSTYSSVVKVNSSATTPGISLYPNPVQNQLNIFFPNDPIYNGANLTLTDVQGLPIRTMAITGGTVHIDVTGFPNGIYFIVVVAKDGNRIRLKFIKQ